MKGDAEESEAERLAALEAAVQRSPTDGEAWGDLGQAYHVMGQMELAVGGPSEGDALRAAQRPALALALVEPRAARRDRAGGRGGAQGREPRARGGALPEQPRPPAAA